MRCTRHPVLAAALLLACCKHPPPETEETPPRTLDAAIEPAADDPVPDVEQDPAPETLDDEEPQARFWKHGAHEDAPPWEPIAPPGPDDCWQEGDVKQITWKFGNKINALTHDDEPACDDALVDALMDDKPAALKKIVSKVDVNCRSAYDWTPLHEAAMGGKKATVKMLLKAGADAGACDMNGETPLHLAVKEGHPAVVKMLLAHGAHADAVDIFTERPLHLVWVGCWDMSTDLDPQCSLQMVKALVSKGADVNAATAEGETPLHIAADYGDAPSVEFLVEKGADVDAEDANGNTPADLAHGEDVEALFLKLLLDDASEKGMK
jgi:hypothetical protein